MADNNQLRADHYRRPVKSYVDRLTRCVNRIDVRLSRQLRNSNDTARRQGKDESGRINNEPIDLENINKKLNDMQEIVDTVSELECFSNGNVSQPTINYFRTFKTSVMKSVRDVLNTMCESFLMEPKATVRPSTFRMKRGRAEMEHADVNHVDVERADVNHANVERTDVNRANVERNANERHAAKRQKTRHDGEETRTVAATDKNASSPKTTTAGTNTSEKKSHLSVVVVDELNWYYKRGIFATQDLFRFMARTIVHRLMDTAILPNDYVVKSTIRRMMPDTRITSQNEILRFLHPFYRQ